MQPSAPALRRRALIGLAAAPLLLGPDPGRAAGTTAAVEMAAPGGRDRAVTLHHLHTGETARLVYHAGGRYLPEALRVADRLLRDWRADRARSTDPALLDLLWELRRRLETDAPIEILCGYRTPETNDLLRRRGGRRSGVARDSLHTRGMAVDLTIPGRPLRAVRTAALSLRRGGVGYYPGTGFVHLDTGPVRAW